MKKLLASIFISLGFAVMVPAVTFAAPVTTPQTNVTGTVTANSTPINGANVTVTCGTHSGSDTTGSDGVYLVTFDAVDCPANSTVNVEAQKGSANGFNSGKANKITTKLNVALVNVSLPEMGLVTGTAAMAAVGGAFLVIRRRKNVEQL